MARIRRTLTIFFAAITLILSISNVFYCKIAQQSQATHHLPQQEEKQHPIQSHLKAFSKKNHGSTNDTTKSVPDESRKIDKQSNMGSNLDRSKTRTIFVAAAATLQETKSNGPLADVNHHHLQVVAPGTVVTAYFEIPSKHSREHYTQWMSYMLAMDDPIVIFTTPDWVDRMKELRNATANRTVIIPVQLDELPIATNYNSSIWEHQFRDLDPISKYRKSHRLYWIWLSKTHFVNEAIRLNPFQSTHYVWSDIGCYRDRSLLQKFGQQTMMKHLDRIPDESVLLVAHRAPNPPKEKWFADSNGGGVHFFTSGSSFACRRETCVTFHDLFLQTLQGFMDRDLFVGEDQLILQGTCLLHPQICQYVPYQEIKGESPYFGLRSVLRYGGNHYHYWKPPRAIL